MPTDEETPDGILGALGETYRRPRFDGWPDPWFFSISPTSRRTATDIKYSGVVCPECGVVYVQTPEKLVRDG